MAYRNPFAKRIFILYLFAAFALLFFYLLWDLPSQENHHMNIKVSGTPVKELPQYPENWIIIDSKNFLIEYCDKYSFWTVLVVDFSFNFTNGVKYQNCISMPESLKNEYSADLQPLIHFAFIYAITHGAQYIYAPNVYGDELETTLEEGDTAVRLSLVSSSVLVLSKNETAIDYENFYYRCSSDRNNCPRRFSLCSCKQLSILSSLTFQTKECFGKMPAIALRPDQYTIPGSDVSIFGYQSFWSLPLFYHSNQKRAADLSCIVQWLLWQSGSIVKLFWSQRLSSLPTVSANDHCLPLVKNLTQCTEPRDFNFCILKTMRKVLHESELKLFEVWMTKLKNSGYKLEKTNHNINNCSEVIFNPAEYSCKNKQESNIKSSLSVNLDSIKSNYKKTCKKSYNDVKDVINFDKPWFQKSNILLLVVFNNPHYGIIPYLEMLYRPFFPIMVYCGPELPDVDKHPNLKRYNYSFITFDIQPVGQVPGALNYQCITKILMMNFRVDGYLNIADDILLLNYAISGLNTDSAWFLPKKEIRVGDLVSLKECRLGLCDFFNRWVWWSDYRDVSLEFLKELEYLAKSSAKFLLYQKTIEVATGGKGRLLGGYSDIFYIPRRLSIEFLELSKLFLKHRVFLEIAVPSIMTCFEPFEDVYPLTGVQVWDAETRDAPWLRFKKSELFGKYYFHPTKWSSVGKGKNISVFQKREVTASNDLMNPVKLRPKMKNEISYNVNNSIEMTNLLCNRVLLYMHDPLGKLPQ